MSPSESTMNSISVIIPCYNNVKTIREAIESVLVQTLVPNEIIVIDDGSTDKSLSILNEYKGKICILKNSHQERAVARNTGIRKAVSKWIAFLDADDVWLSDKLEKQIKIVQQHPECVLSYTQAKLIDTLGNGCSMYGKNLIGSGNPRPSIMLEELLKDNPIPLSTVLVKKDVIEKYGLFNEKLVYIEDWELWLRLSSWGCQFHFLPEITTRFRFYGENVFIVKRIEANQLEQTLQVLTNFWKEHQSLSLQHPKLKKMSDKIAIVKTELPTIEELVKNVELYEKNDKFNFLMNQEPPKSWVKEHPYIRGHKYLPIDTVKYLLRKIFKECI